MPVLIMCSKLCPDQVEGSVYALTCVVNNIGNQIAMNFSSLLTTEFGITLENYDNLWQLHLVVVLFMFIPLIFVPLTPNRPGDGNPDELRRTVTRMENKLTARRAKRQALKLSSASAASGDGTATATGAVLTAEDAAAAGVSSSLSVLAAAEARGNSSSSSSSSSNSADSSNATSSASATNAEEGSEEDENAALSGSNGGIRRRRGDAESADSDAAAAILSSASHGDDDDADARGAGEAAPLTGAMSRDSDAPEATPNTEHDGDAAPARKGRCCSACSCCDPLEDDEGEIDETTVTDSAWAAQEARMERDLETARQKAQDMVQPTSKYGGGMFLAVIFGSLIWSTGDAAYRLSNI